MNAPACRAVRTCERLHGGSRHPFPRSDAQPRVAQTDGPWPTAPSVCPLEGHLPLLPPVPTDAPSHLGLKPPEKPGTSRDLLGGSSTRADQRGAGRRQTQEFGLQGLSSSGPRSPGHKPSCLSQEETKAALATQHGPRGRYPEVEAGNSGAAEENEEAPWGGLL